VKNAKKELKQLFEEMSALVKEPATAQRSLVALVELWKVMSALVSLARLLSPSSLTVAPPLAVLSSVFVSSKAPKELNVAPLIAQVVKLVEESLRESVAYIEDDVAMFVSVVDEVRANAAPVLDAAALAPLQRADGSIMAIDYVTRFKAQMKANFTRLEKLPVQNLKKHYGAQSKALKLLLGGGHLALLTRPVLDAQATLVTHTRQLKDDWLDMIIVARSHLTALRDQLEQLHAFAFTADTTALVAYFGVHGAELEAVFGDGAQPTLPVSVPLFTQLKETRVTLSKAEEMEAVRKTYRDMRSTVAETAAAMPKTWPQSVPNLSTHDTLPPLVIASPADFSTVLVAFNAYLDALLSIAERWSVALRVIFEFLEDSDALDHAVAAASGAASAGLGGLGGLGSVGISELSGLSTAIATAKPVATDATTSPRTLPGQSAPTKAVSSTTLL